MLQVLPFGKLFCVVLSVKVPAVNMRNYEMLIFKKTDKLMSYNCNFDMYSIFVGWANDGREGWRLVIRCISETPTLSVACKCFVVSNTQLSQSRC